MKKLEKNILPVFYKKKPRRPLSKKQKSILNCSLKKFLLNKNHLDKKEKFLEIGFGYGENLINLSKKNKEKLIIGCEIYEPGITNLVENIERVNLKNIKIYPKNIFSLFNILKKNSIEKIFILYPDPWPKKKHFKRRLISKNLLKKLNKVLKLNGEIFISTDSEDYLYKILFEFFLNKNFFWINNKVTNCYKRPNEIVETKYEKKANLKKNKKFYLKFKKIC